MNYEFHVGDYVETWDGEIGYIYYFRPNVLVFKTPDGGQHEIYTDLLDWSGHPSNIFKRIGAYDFTKQEKKIKNLPCVTSTIDYGSNSWLVDKVVEARNKINELVDAVNELMNKEDEE
uniref:Uncharacterized protein n=1 Tax=Siphoviridae sp. ctKcB20 TaxID=2827568 RepID=A0A8S5LLP9_9CAUD|nr:MAG TPA: hypothetical protein [Siphoviridae sp. ctKcB20]